MLVNSVMTTDAKSRIFDDFLLMQAKLERTADYLVTRVESPAADVFHYHRSLFSGPLWEPSVVTLHHSLKQQINFSNTIERCREAQAVVVLSTENQSILKDFGVESQVIPHGFTPTVARSTRSGSRSAVVSLGVFSKHYRNDVKGDERLIALARSLIDQPVRFVLLGEGRVAFAHHLRRMGVSVEAYDNLSYPSVLQLQSSLTAQLILSKHEGGPASLVESLNLGIPVLTTQVGMAADYIVDGANGLILPKDFPSQLESLRAFIGSPKLQASLAEGARHTPNLISWEEVFQKYREVYSCL